MALLLTSAGLQKRAAAGGVDALPPAVAASAALGSSALIGLMRPGGMKTLAGLACLGGGGYFAVVAQDKLARSLAMGVASGGLWSLLMRS